MAGTIASLFVNIGADVSAFETAMENVQSSMEDVGSKMSEVGGTLTAGITVPLAAIGAAGLLAASDVENALGKIQAGLGVTKDEAAGLKDEAKELWLNGFGENVADAADGIMTVKKNMVGLNSDELKGATESAYTLADAFGIEIAASTSLADNLMATFGTDSQTAFDTITTGFQNGLDYGEDFADTLREYGPIFQGMGMDLDATLSFLKTAQSAGFRNLDVAADTFKEFSILASEGSEEFATAVGLMDKETQKLYKGFQEGKVSGEDLFYGIAGGLDSIVDPTARFNAGVALMGTMFEDNGETAIKNMAYMRDELGAVEGATTAAGTAIYDTFGAKLEGVWRNLQGSLEPVGIILLDLAEKALPPITSAITTMAEGFSNLSTPMQTAIVIFGLIAAVIPPIVVGIGILVSSFATLTPIFTAIGVAAGTVATFFGAITAPIWAIIAGIAAVIAIGVLLWKNWDEVSAKATEIWGAIKEFLSATWESVKETASTVWNAIKETASNIWSAIVQTIMTVITPIVEGVTTLFNSMKDGINTIFEGIKQYFSGVWEIIKNIFVGALLLIVDLVTGDFEGLKTDALAIWDNIKDGMDDVWEGIKKIFTGALDAVKGYVSTVWKALKTITSTIFGAVRDKISEVWESIKTKSANAPEEIKNTVKDKFEALKNAVGEKMEAAKEKITTIWESAKTFLSGIDLGDIGRNIIQGLIDGISGMAGKVWDKVKDVGDGIKEKLKDVLDIHSPSKETEWMGQMLGEGIVNGMDQSLSTISNMSGKMASAALPNVSSRNQAENTKSANGLTVNVYPQQATLDENQLMRVFQRQVMLYD